MADYFLELLGKHKEKHGILVHSYCIMGTHPHVTLTSTNGQQAFSAFWRVVNHQLACRYNHLKQRKGQVVMERLRSPAIEPGGRHMLTVMRYGDLNPVRARLCRSPKDHTHSSYRHYAFGDPNPLIDDAPDYLALGDSPTKRRLAYQNLFGAMPAKERLEKRDDLSRGPFIGGPGWVELQMLATGLTKAPSG